MLASWQSTSPDEGAAVKQRESPFRDDASDSQLSCDRCVVNDRVSSGGGIVNDLLWGNRYFVNNPLWCDGDVVRYPLLSDGDLRKCPLSCDRVAVPAEVTRCVDLEPSVLCEVKKPGGDMRAAFCVMNHLTGKVLRRRPGASGCPRVKDLDPRANWRRRHRTSLVWWLLLFLLGAAPLASGQLRPKTDISSSRAEGGK